MWKEKYLETSCFNKLQTLKLQRAFIRCKQQLPHLRKNKHFSCMFPHHVHCANSVWCFPGQSLGKQRKPEAHSMSHRVQLQTLDFGIHFTLSRYCLMGHHWVSFLAHTKQGASPVFYSQRESASADFISHEIITNFSFDTVWGWRCMTCLAVRIKIHN